MNLLALKGLPVLKFFYAANLLLLGLSSLLIAAQAAAQPAKHRVVLNKTVSLSDDERAFIQSLPTLKVAAYQNAAPLSFYDEKSQQYSGLSIDVFRFIAEQIGLSYQFVLAKTEALQGVKTGLIDVYMPVSAQPERLLHGMFTDSYFDDYYAVIARKDSQLQITDSSQLSQYQIGAVKRASILPYLESVMPSPQLHGYADGSLFKRLRRGELDAVVYLARIFEQDRLGYELFDLEKVHTLYEAPRSYSFMFARSEQNQQLVKIFNYFISALDSSQSLQWHSDGEHKLIQRYIAQRDRQYRLWTVLALISCLLLILLLVYVSHRQIVMRLAKSHLRIVQQQQALQDANHKLEQLTQVDELTGLASRRHFDRIFTLEYARHLRSGKALSVLMVDVDFFKSINDHYGHAVGDLYLQKIAAVLQASMLRSSDLAARYGGEEFICLLPDTNSKGAVKVAEAIRQKVMALQLANAEREPQPVTISIGVATTTGLENSAKALLLQADEQLYRAKHAGRNRVCSVRSVKQSAVLTEDEGNEVPQ